MNNKTNGRIELADALRGFALLGIMILHAIEHFDFYHVPDKNPEIFNSIDPYVLNIVYFLFSGKSYSIFSLMFGFSFFIQMDRAKSKGIDFTWRFLWRLTILLMIGYLFSLIYIGEILTIYALMGIPLILFYRVDKKVLTGLAVLFILQIPTIINIISSYTNPDFALERNFGRGLYGEAFDIFANGSFCDVVKFNSWKGHIAVWAWTYYNGRYLQLFGLFLIGLALGKIRFFENYEKYRKAMIVTLVTAFVTFSILFTLLRKLPTFGIPEPRFGMYYTLIKSYSDIALTTVYVSIIIIIHQIVNKKNAIPNLASYGRMSLTNYILQPLIGIPLFYGYGLALYPYFGPTMSLLYGILFLVLQIWFSKIWLKHFFYGPFEWLWRSLTFFDFNIKFSRER